MVDEAEEVDGRSAGLEGLTTDQNLRLTNVLEGFVRSYVLIGEVIDLSTPRMVVHSEDSEKILRTYFCLYGQAISGHSGNYPAQKYDRLMTNAKEFCNLPEVKGFMTRLELARKNMETAVRDLPQKDVTELRYARKELEGRLILSQKITD